MEKKQETILETEIVQPESTGPFEAKEEYRSKIRRIMLGNYDYGFLCMPYIPFFFKSKRRLPPFFGINAPLPILLSIVLGLQHALAMVSGVVTPSIILGGGGFLNLDMDYRQYMISSALIVSALCTTIQITSFTYRGVRIGTGLLSVVGTSFTSVPLAASIFGNMYKTGFCPSMVDETGTTIDLPCPQGLGAFIGTSMLCSLLPMGLSLLPPRALKRMFPPIVTGSTVFLIGLSLIASGFKGWGGGSGSCLERPATGMYSVCPNLGAPNAKPWGDPSYLGLGLVVYVSIVLIEYFGSPFLKNIQMVAGLIVGIIVAAATGYIDHSTIDNAPVATFLWVKRFPLTIYAPGIVPLLIVYLVAVVEAVGDITASCEASRAPVEGPEFEGRIKGGILCDGVNSLLAGCCTSLPLSTFAQNNGIIALTRCASRSAGYWCAFFMLLMGVFAKFSAVFLALPSATIGGLTTFLFSTVAVAGIRILAYLEWTRRERFIVSAAMALGLGVNLVPNWFSYVLTYDGPNQALRGFLDSVEVIVSTGFCIAAIITSFLNAVLPTETGVQEMFEDDVDNNSVDEPTKEPHIIV